MISFLYFPEFAKRSVTFFINGFDKYVYQYNSGQNGSRTGGQNQMSHEVLITRRQSIFIFLQIQAEAGLSNQYINTLYVLAVEARLCLDLQKNQKCFVFWLLGPLGTSNFDRQSLIHFDLNYTSHQCNFTYHPLKININNAIYFNPCVAFHKSEHMLPTMAKFLAVLCLHVNLASRTSCLNLK